MTNYIPTDVPDMIQIVSNLHGIYGFLKFSVGNYGYPGIPASLEAARALVSQDAYNIESNYTTSIDNANAFIAACTTVEKSIATSWATALNPILIALDTYVTAQTGQSFKYWYDSSTDNRMLVAVANDQSGIWSGVEDFRNLWRVAKGTELIAIHDSWVRSEGNWNRKYGNNVPINNFYVDTPMEIRAGNTYTRSGTTINDIYINLTLQKADNTYEVSVVTVPAGTAYGTKFPLISSNPVSKSEYVTLNDWVIYGGSDGDCFEIWSA